MKLRYKLSKNDLLEYACAEGLINEEDLTTTQRGEYVIVEASVINQSIIMNELGNSFDDDELEEICKQ